MRISVWSSDVCSSDLQDRRGWREKLRDWAEDVELVPDLGQRVGSFTWFRGLATSLGLCAAALYLSPGFHPLPGAPQRSEERRVGTVWLRTSRSRWKPYE